MYPQCRYLRPGGQVCRAVALKGTQWCYHHGRLHERYRAQKASHRLHNQRDAAGRFTPAHHNSPKANCVDTRSRQPSRPHPAPADSSLAAAAPNPASSANLPAPSSLFPQGEAPHPPPLTLPPIKDSAAIQLALTDVLQALAANQLDPKRASILLYGLQVASTHAKQTSAKHVSLRSDGISTATPDHAIEATTPS